MSDQVWALHQSVTFPGLPNKQAVVRESQVGTDPAGVDSVQSEWQHFGYLEICIPHIMCLLVQCINCLFGHL